MGKIIATMDEVAIGNTASTWANAPAAERSKVQMHTGSVPVENAVAIVGWSPVAIKVPTVTDWEAVDADGNLSPQTYDMPDRLATAIGRVRPDGSRAIINVVGGGFAAAKDIHNSMREATYRAVDSELDIILAACHNDGEFLCLQMTAREGLKVGGIGGDIVPIVTLMSSLTGNTKTRLSTGSLRLFCTNQMRAFKAGIVNEVAVKRTRNAEDRVAEINFDQAMEFSFADAAEFVLELERLSNIEVNDAELAMVLDAWMPLHEKDGTPMADGRGRTIRENTRGTFCRLLARDPRVNLGQTVGGLWMAHNTFGHWEQTSRGSDNRIARMAERASLGESDKADAEFMSIVAGIIPEANRLLATV